MRIAPSVELVIQIAGYEAVGARFSEIQPEHVLIGILKLAELPLKDARGVSPRAEAVEQLAAEIKAIQQRFVEHGIDGTVARRRLRQEMGKGDAGAKPGELHRSSATRRLFDEAERLAAKARQSTLSPAHLFDALLDAPTPSIKQVLGHRAAGGAAKTGDSLLDKHGRDLTRLAASHELAEVTGREAECTALARALATDHLYHTVLVGAQIDAAQEVVHALAHAIVARRVPDSLAGRRLRDLHEAIGGLRPRGQTAELLRDLLGAARDEADVFLILGVERTGGSETSNRIWQMLRAAMMQPAPPIILLTTEAVYERLMSTDRVWKRHVEVMKIADRRTGGIPREL